LGGVSRVEAKGNSVRVLLLGLLHFGARRRGAGAGEGHSPAVRRSPSRALEQRCCRSTEARCECLLLLFVVGTDEKKHTQPTQRNQTTKLFDFVRVPMLGSIMHKYVNTGDPRRSDKYGPKRKNNASAPHLNVESHSQLTALLTENSCRTEPCDLFRPIATQTRSHTTPRRTRTGSQWSTNKHGAAASGGRGRRSGLSP
jgi:hypothetical protein